tara:strand:+ start:15702 stop:15926 length:225 start_codon:yes stop_codon:yes gene_type:complete
MRLSLVLAWFFQTTIMMIPFIIGGAVGVAMHREPSGLIASLILGVGIFRLFDGKETFDAWKEENIKRWFEVWSQ